MKEYKHADRMDGAGRMDIIGFSQIVVLAIVVLVLVAFHTPHEFSHRIEGRVEALEAGLLELKEWRSNINTKAAAIRKDQAL